MEHVPVMPLQVEQPVATLAVLPVTIATYVFSEVNKLGQIFANVDSSGAAELKGYPIPYVVLKAEDELDWYKMLSNGVADIIQMTTLAPMSLA